jgi:hypothetical protein
MNTETQDTNSGGGPAVWLVGAARWEWAVARTEQLVDELRREHVSIARGQEIELMDRSRMAREIAARRTGQVTVSGAGRGRLRFLGYRLRARLVRPDAFVWANEGGGSDVLINVGCAAQSDEAYKKLLADVLGRAFRLVPAPSGDFGAGGLPEVVIGHYYTARKPMALEELGDFMRIIFRGDSRIRCMPEVPIEVERDRRLRVAAHADLNALAALAEGNMEEAALLENAAIALALALRDFDTEYYTGCGRLAPNDLWWEASGLARIYTRQEWAARRGEE